MQNPFLDDAFAAINEITRLRYPPAPGVIPERTEDDTSRILKDRKLAELLENLMVQVAHYQRLYIQSMDTTAQAIRVLTQAFKERPEDPHLNAMMSIFLGVDHG
jgi:hypothetical protein